MSQIINQKKDYGLAILTITSIAIAMFLGFIDEGHYNFKWMNNIGNWIALSVYALFIFLGQLLFYKVILRGYKGQGKALLSCVGAILGILFVVYFIFTNWQ